MKLTKYTHSCLILEEQGKRLIIDPGEWNTDLADLSNIIAIVVTHAHFDHCNAAIIQSIVAANPSVTIFGAAEVNTVIPSAKAVKASDKVTVGPFELQSYGDRHALVHDDKPHSQNIGVLVNQTFYYPGDSFAAPDGTAVKTLALPVSGPWLKLGEAMDFLANVKPQMCLPTHDNMLSKDGAENVDAWLTPWCETLNIKYQRLNPGDSVTC